MATPLSRITVGAFRDLLLLAAVGAALAALNPGAMLAKTAKPSPMVVCVAEAQTARHRPNPDLHAGGSEMNLVSAHYAMPLPD